MVGIAHDPVFGPVISFGAGGTAVEIFADSQVALPPLNEYLSKDMIRGTRASKFLKKFRNLPEADIRKLVGVLQRISEIACELPEICELDINPLLVDERRRHRGRRPHRGRTAGRPVPGTTGTWRSIPILRNWRPPCSCPTAPT
jgi:hypothetical protein